MKPKRINPTAAAIAVLLALSSCTTSYRSTEDFAVPRSTFDLQLRSEANSELTGWIKVGGEVQFFHSREAMELDLRYPYCVTGIVPDELRETTTRLRGRQVAIQFDLYEYDLLDTGSLSWSTRRYVGNTPISNWCFGDFVFVLRGIKPIE